MHKQIEYNGASMSYYVHGSGAKCLVFVHGFAEDHTVFINQVVQLKADYKILLIDLPGCGTSEAWKIDYDMASLADLINAVTEKEKLEKFVLLGHSMGGYIALEYLSIYPQKLLGLALLHSSVYKDDADKIEKRKQAIEVITQKGKEIYLDTTYRSLLHGEDHVEIYLPILKKMGEKIPDKDLIKYIEAMMERRDHADTLAKHSIPFCVIIGKHDQAVPFEVSMRQTHLADHTYIKVLEGTGHLGMLEEAPKFNRELAIFLENVEW